MSIYSRKLMKKRKIEGEVEVLTNKISQVEQNKKLKKKKQETASMDMTGSTQVTVEFAEDDNFIEMTVSRSEQSKFPSQSEDEEDMDITEEGSDLEEGELNLEHSLNNNATIFVKGQVSADSEK